MSETGQPITQPVAVQQQGAAAAAHPAFEDNYAYGHYEVVDNHQDYDMHADATLSLELWSGSRLVAVSVKPIARDMIRDKLGLNTGQSPRNDL